MTVDINWDYSYTWRIKNCSVLSCKNGNKLSSPEFRVKSLRGRTWCLWLYPEGDTAYNKGFVSYFLCQIRENESDKECLIDYELILMNANGDILTTRMSKNKIFGRDSDQWGFEKLIENDKLKAEIAKCSEDLLIFRCRMKNKDVSTKMKAEKYCLKWPVQVLPNGIFTSARHFFCLDNLLLKMILFLNDGDFCVKLCNLTKCVIPSHPVTGKISVLDTKGNETLSKTTTHTFDVTRESKTWEFPLLMTNKKLQDKMSNYVIDGNIVFWCEFSLHFEGLMAATVSNPNSETISNIKGLVSLFGDFQSLFSDHSHSDVKLRVKGEVELNAHRSILAARSAVFSAMFNEEMLENCTGIVVIEDVDLNTLKSFLEFLYTGILNDIDYGKATKLLIVADRYQVPSLKEVCASFLVSAISLKKVCEILVLADMVSHEHLKIMCFGYISTDVKDIFPSLEWIELIKKHADLAAEVTTYYGKNCATCPNCS